ncbi:porin [Thermovibrio ammonificans]
MRKALLALSAVLIASTGAGAQEVSTQEILQKLQALEQKVQQLEKENRQLRKLLSERGYAVSPGRSTTDRLKVGGRVLFRGTYSENEGKTIWGDPANGFTVRKARLFVSGKVNDDTKFKIMIRADRGAPVELWDAHLTYSPSYLPFGVKMGLFKVPLSLSYLKSGTKLSLPERPVAVNWIAPVWRDVGVALQTKPLYGVKFTAAVINGDGWNSSKIYNQDGKYAYVFAADAKLVSNDSYGLRFRLGYEGGTDHSPKLVYTKYGAVSVKRHLIDAETELSLKDYGLTFMGGYLFDNPTDAKSSTGASVSLGNAKGYYIQVDWGTFFDSKLHLVGRYSWVDPNDNVDDSYDVDYTTFGFYYLIHGWQTALRASYTFAHERHGSGTANNLLTTEFQLLF